MKTIEEMKARLAEIVSKLGGFENVESLTVENVAEIEEFHAEAEELQTQIEAKEKVTNILAKSKLSAGRKVTPSVVTEKTVAKKNGGFDNSAEFFMAVKDAGQGKFDARFSNTYFEKNGDEAGFLVPEEIMTEITKSMQADDALLGKTRNFKISGNSLSLPIDETQPWNGGMIAYWTEEGGDIKEGSSKLGRAHFRLNKLALALKITEELAEDAPALASYVQSMAPIAFNHKINSAILLGNGIGKPNGIIDSPFTVVIEKEVGQVADTIVAKNVIKMYSRMFPQSRGNAVWYVNAQLEESLRLMKDDNGNFIYLSAGSQMNQSPYSTLLGRPVVFMMGSLNELGTKGDIVFADFNYYYSVTKTSGVKQSISAHVHFLQDIQTMKWTFRVDGRCPFTKPVFTEKGGHKMSAFVVLEDR